jgi:transposase
MRRFGVLGQVGVEGTGAYGAGLSRLLTSEGVEVVEINRPDRQRRRRRGKSDTTDAEAAARAVLSGDAAVVPKTGSGQVEGLRALRIARRSARKARTQTALQIRDLILTAPDTLRTQLEPLPAAQRAQRCARFRCGDPTDPFQAIKRALRILGRRYNHLSVELDELDELIADLCAQINPALLGAKGVGPEVAATLLVIAGDNPERLRSDAALAALCGASPIEASSGRVVRHRLNRGGNREGNNALWRIVLVRMATCPRTKAYVERRTAEGRSKKEIIRCLQRYVAREVHSLLVKDRVVISGDELRAERARRNKSLAQAAEALNTWPIKLSRLERGLEHDTDMTARYSAWLLSA